MTDSTKAELIARNIVLSKMNQDLRREIKRYQRWGLLAWVWGTVKKYFRVGVRS